MGKITFECETITPMFCYGADQTTPEIRAASIKGAMRFWWRALHPDLDIDELRKKETEIFGGAGDGDAKRSSFTVRVLYEKREDIIVSTLWTEIPHFVPSGKTYNKPNNGYEGLQYLFYSLVMPKNDKPYIKTGTSFNVLINCENKKHIGDIIESFKVLSLFGGLGSRTRRGAGNFTIKSVTVSENKELEEKIVEQIKNSSPETYSIKHSANVVSDFSYLKGSKLYILKKENSWVEALKGISKIYQEFRDKRRGEIAYTPNFGFPVLHRNQKTTMGAGVIKKKYNKKENKEVDVVSDFLERRSSPIIFHLYKDSIGNHVPFILWLNGDFLPSGYKITDKKVANKADPSENILKEFINSINDKKEVTL